MNRLDPSVKTIWALGILVKMFFFASIFFLIELIFIKPNLNYEIPSGMTSLAIFFFSFILAIIYPLLKYKFWFYEIRQEEIFLRRGIITRITTIAPFNRVQHIDVQQNIFERMMNLARLVIYTAGTRGADLVIPGLPLEYAEMLRDQLKNYTTEDAL